MKILALNLDRYDAKYFYYLEPKTNLIMTGIFTKIIYTEPYYTINDIFYYFPIYYTYIEYHNESYIVKFDKLHPENKVMLDKIYKLETEILCNYAGYMNCRKMSCMNVYNKLLSGSFRISMDIANANTKHDYKPFQGNGNGNGNIHSNTQTHHNHNSHNKQFLLKISGIWENETQFGITAKIVESNG